MILMEMLADDLIKENTFGGSDEREKNSGYSWKL